jgi:hypothetical protein
MAVVKSSVSHDGKSKSGEKIRSTPVRKKRDVKSEGKNWGCGANLRL